MGEWIDGWMDGWMDQKVLSISLISACSPHEAIIFQAGNQMGSLVFSFFNFFVRVLVRCFAQSVGWLVGESFARTLRF